MGLITPLSAIFPFGSTLAKNSRAFRKVGFSCGLCAGGTVGCALGEAEPPAGGWPLSVFFPLSPEDGRTAGGGELFSFSDKGWTTTWGAACVLPPKILLSAASMGFRAAIAAQASTITRDTPKRHPQAEPRAERDAELFLPLLISSSRIG
jgi:hypothetical protein